MKKLLLIAVVALSQTLAPAQPTYQWQDPKLPTAQRVENLLGMSRSELVGILGRAEENATRKIPVARSGARGRASRGR